MANINKLSKKLSENMLKIKNCRKCKIKLYIFIKKYTKRFFSETSFAEKALENNGKRIVTKAFINGIDNRGVKQHVFIST